MAKTPKLSDKKLSPLDALQVRQAEPEPTPAPTAAESSKADRKETHTQISAYIPNDLYKAVRVSLIGQKNAAGEKLTLTDLLIKLLSDWQREQD